MTSIFQRGCAELKALRAMGLRDSMSRLGYLLKMVGLRIAHPEGASKYVSDRGNALIQLARSQTLAERLGYGPQARLLIVHADDIGLTHSVDAAFIEGHESGLINSGSVMVTCPWFPEIVAFARAHPELDLGVHLTLTSERTNYRWGPVAPRDKVRSLVDKLGYLHQTWTAETHVRPYEVEIELRAQIEKAYAAGLRPTHLDSHQYRLQQGGRDLFLVLLSLGREYRLPVFVARNWFAQWPYLELANNSVVIDHTVTIDESVAPEAWPEFYRLAIESLPFGVSEIVIHPGLNNQELQAFSADRPTWGAAWRQRDFDFFTSVEFRSLLTKHDVNLISWREIAAKSAHMHTRKHWKR